MARSEPADGELVRGGARAPPAGPERRRSRCRSPGSSSGSPNPARRSSSWCRRRASSRRPTRSRSATASAACASSARSTGASSSRRMSVVEQTLREDPAGVYARMDFATRDRYRHVVENARQAQRRCPKREVARSAIELAQAARRERDGDDRDAHVGYYLIDDGLPRARARGRRARCRRSSGCARSAARHPLAALSRRDRAAHAARRAACLLTSAHAGGARGWMLALVGVLVAAAPPASSRWRS